MSISGLPFSEACPGNLAVVGDSTSVGQTLHMMGNNVTLDQSGGVMPEQAAPAPAPVSAQDFTV